MADKTGNKKELLTKDGGSKILMTFGAVTLITLGVGGYILLGSSEQPAQPKSSDQQKRTSLPEAPISGDTAVAAMNGVTPTYEKKLKAYDEMKAKEANTGQNKKTYMPTVSFNNERDDGLNKTQEELANLRAKLEVLKQKNEDLQSQIEIAQMQQQYSSGNSSIAYYEAGGVRFVSEGVISKRQKVLTPFVSGLGSNSCG